MCSTHGRQQGPGGAISFLPVCRRPDHLHLRALGFFPTGRASGPAGAPCVEHVSSMAPQYSHGAPERERERAHVAAAGGKVRCLGARRERFYGPVELALEDAGVIIMCIPFFSLSHVGGVRSTVQEGLLVCCWRRVRLAGWCFAPGVRIFGWDCLMGFEGSSAA